MNQERKQRLLDKMRAMELDALVLSSPMNIYYLTGQMTSAGERLMALVMHADGQCHFVGNQLIPFHDPDVSCITYRDWEASMEFLTAILPPMGTVGIERSWPSGFTFSLMSWMPRALFVNGSRCIEAVRMIKEPGEIELMKRSSRKNDEVMGELIKKIHGEMTEAELRKWLPVLMEQRGGEFQWGIIAFGPNAAEAHHEGDDTRLRSGDNIVMDIGCPYERYHSDMTRTVFYHHVEPEMERIYSLVRLANEEVIKAARPGVSFDYLDRLSKDVIAEGGYGQYYNHRVGHGVGLEIHEPPFVCIGNRHSLKPGMIFSVEPGIYKPGQGGVRIEDLILITEDGCQVLNSYPKDLMVV